MPDEYIKIAGDHPSKEIESNKSAGNPRFTDAATVAKSRELGVSVADKLLASSDKFAPAEVGQSAEMALQKELLLSFTALGAFENEISSSDASDVAHNAFLKEIGDKRPDLYEILKSSGALSFYYLAFRRGIEVDRRMGQTFAMLCGHDGDPVYQELGEALYCWFYSKISDKIAACGLS